MERNQLIAQRKVVLSDLQREDKQLFFGSLYPGSHEFTEEGFQAAQKNADNKERLRVKLADLNGKLGLPAESCDEVVE